MEEDMEFSGSDYVKRSFDLWEIDSVVSGA